MALEYGTDRLSRNVGKELPIAITLCRAKRKGRFLSVVIVSGISSTRRNGKQLRKAGPLSKEKLERSLSVPSEELQDVLARVQKHLAENLFKTSIRDKITT